MLTTKEKQDIEKDKLEELQNNITSLKSKPEEYVRLNISEKQLYNNLIKKIEIFIFKKFPRRSKRIKKAAEEDAKEAAKKTAEEAAEEAAKEAKKTENDAEELLEYRINKMVHVLRF
mgnify:CR=1 FL=1